MNPTLPVVQFIMDSDNDSVDSDEAHLKVRFDDPIRLKTDKRYVVQVTNGKIPNTVPNVSEAIGNNTIRYSTDDGKNYKVITFADGIYDTTEANREIQYRLWANSDFYTEVATGLPKYPFALCENTATSHAYVFFNTSYKGSEEYKDYLVDLTNDSKSTFNETWGFTEAESKAIDGANIIEYATGYMDVYDSQVTIKCPQVMSYRSGKLVRELITFNLGGVQGSFMSVPNNDTVRLVQATLDYQSELREFEIQLVDRSGASLIFADDSTDGNLLFNFAIFEVD